MAISSRASVAGGCCCVMRGGNGVQGIDGHGAADGRALRRRLLVRLAETGNPPQMAPVRRSRDVMAGAGCDDVVGSEGPLGWVLERRQFVDLPAQPGPHARPV